MKLGLWYKPQHTLQDEMAVYVGCALSFWHFLTHAFVVYQKNYLTNLQPMGEENIP